MLSIKMMIAILIMVFIFFFMTKVKREQIKLREVNVVKNKIHVEKPEYDSSYKLGVLII